MDGKELYDKLKTYIGKEVICGDGEKRTIDEVRSYAISVKVRDGLSMRYMTGTGDRDNAVARGNIRFVDESLTEEFLEVYEAYRESDWGRLDDFEYYSFTYD